MTSTQTRSQLTPVLRENGQQRYADAGATRQGDRKPMKSCGTCGAYVVFVQSTKTGKWYLADTFRYGGDTEAYYYVKASPHFKTCGDRVKVNEAIDAQIAEERKYQQRERVLAAWRAEMQAAGIEITREMYEAKQAETE